jgi:hypothetical protein
MTMAPGRKKRGYWIEILFISVLLFLLMGSRSQTNHTPSAANTFGQTLQRGLTVQPVTF